MGRYAKHLGSEKRSHGIYRSGLAGRRVINARMRLEGHEPAPGRDMGVKRAMRWMKRVSFANPPRCTFERSLRYLNRGARERYELQLEQIVAERG